MQLAFPLFSKAPTFTATSLSDALSKRLRGHKIEAESDDGSVLGINVDGASVLVSRMPAPFPASDLAGIHPFSKRGWHKSSESAERNIQHAIVTVVGASTPKLEALAVTLVVAELCASDICLGVFWGTSGVLAHRTTFLEGVSGVDLNAPALSIWVGAEPYQGGDGFGLRTRGLAELVGRDLHFLPHRSHNDLGILFGRALDFSEYLYREGLVVLDGQSLGYSKTDVLRAKWTDEPVEGGNEVTRWIELAVEAAR